VAPRAGDPGPGVPVGAGPAAPAGPASGVPAGSGGRSQGLSGSLEPFPFTGS
jgi:hypothetical protein